MKDLNEGKVQQWLGYMMSGCFCWITYFNFQGFFRGIVDMFAALPFWWFLIVLPLFAMSVVWSISLGEQEIKALEEQVQKNQQMMAQRERCLRLIHYDVQQIPPLQFEYYCADLLRLLGYQEVKVTKSKRISALTSEGNRVYIGCKQKKSDDLIEQHMLENFHSVMIRDEVSEGIFITTSSFSQQAIEWVKECNITCIDGNTLSELILFATRESREQLKKYSLRE